MRISFFNRMHKNLALTVTFSEKFLSLDIQSEAQCLHETKANEIVDQKLLVL